MNIVDLVIILLGIGAVARGYRLGLVHQTGSTIGFIGGLLIGSWISSAITPHLLISSSKSIAGLATVLVSGFIFMSIGEVIGIRLKQKVVRFKPLNTVDGGLGSATAVLTLLFAIWLGASILVLGPNNGFQQALKSSRILGKLDGSLPPATTVLSSLNKLIDPNGFPQVFSGLEPSPNTNTPLPSLGALDPVVQAARASVVKVEGTGCGGIVEGSGFVMSAGKIVTNAHVIAGVTSPKVLDANGVHNTRVVLFDPDVDLAVLQVSNLAGTPLAINATEQTTNTAAVVLGYPGGGSFDAQPATVIDQFSAYGRNIYGQGDTTRDVYSLHAKVIPGNSGGPLVGTDGSVLGIVFATSTTYNDVGYALTGRQVAGELATAEQATATVSTGSCSE